MSQYTKDKSFRFTFRVNEKLYTWVQAKSEKLGVTPCDFVRSIVFNQMAAEDFFHSSAPRHSCFDHLKRQEPVAEIARTTDENNQDNQ